MFANLKATEETLQWLKNSSEVRTAIRKYVQALEENGIRVEQVLLYGSHAKNAAHPDSDIDIIIVSENFIGKHLIERLQLLGWALRNVPEPIEAMVLPRKKFKNATFLHFGKKSLKPKQ